MAFQECPLIIKLSQLGKTRLKSSAFCYVYDLPSFRYPYITIKKKKKGTQTEEIAQWIKHLPQKHEELNSNPQNPHKAGDSSLVCL